MAKPKRKAPTQRSRSGPKVLTNCKGKGGFCDIKRPAGNKGRVAYPGFDYTQAGVGKRKGPVCNIKSARCPVQLVFKGGKPYVRFCEQRYKTGEGKGRGRTPPVQGKVAADMPADNARHAQRMAAKACAVWGTGRAEQQKSFAKINWKKISAASR